MMNFLSENEIIKQIIEYVNEDIYNYAVMIDGGWGYGKTYFIKQKLIPEIEEIKIDQDKTKKSVYISLYGLKDTEEIVNQIYLRIFEFRLGDKGKFLPLLGFGSKIIADKLGVTEAIDTQKGDALNYFTDYKNYVLIFDDLERCAIPVNSLLGFINNFVEQNDLKALLVANQNEIGILNNEQNLELKYLLASQTTINYDEIEDNKKSNSSKINNNCIDRKTLKMRTNYIFEENVLYNQIKEKLIGKTIYYRPELGNIVPIVVEKCFSKEIIIELEVPADKIKQIVVEESHYNIRTIQFALLFFKSIYNLMSTDLRNKQCYVQLFNEVLIAILKVSISFKQGKKNYNWEPESEYGYIKLDEAEMSLHNYFQSFKFIHDYVYYSTFNESKIKSVLNDYSRELEIKDDPIKYMRYYWEQEDDYLVEQLEIFSRKFAQDEYQTIDYSNILEILLILEKIGITTIDTNDVHQKMLQKIESNGGKVNSYRESMIKKNNSLYPRFKSMIEELVNCEKAFEEEQLGSDINSIFLMESGWGTAFYDCFFEHQNEYFARQTFFARVNIEKCTKKIDDATTKEFSDFRRSFATIYGESNWKDKLTNDYQSICELRRKLSEKKYASKTKEFNREYFLDFLDVIILQIDEKIPADMNT